MQWLYSLSIFTLNVFYTCEKSNQAEVKLIAKTLVNRLKSSVDPKQVIINFPSNIIRRNYVMPEAFKKSFRTRSFLIMQNKLKVYFASKEAGFFFSN